MNLTPDITARIQPFMDLVAEHQARFEENFAKTSKVSAEDKLDLLLAFVRQQTVYQVLDAVLQLPDNAGRAAIMELSGPISRMRTRILLKMS